ncbi:MAG: hypothetical protein DRN06_07280, partial [Thermoprotei archaeon]
GEPPLCSSDCRARFEAQRVKGAKWHSIFNIILILMMVWFLFLLLTSSW